MSAAFARGSAVDAKLLKILPINVHSLDGTALRTGFWDRRNEMMATTSASLKPSNGIIGPRVARPSGRTAHRIVRAIWPSL
jgi:hypothetical protein